MPHSIRCFVRPLAAAVVLVGMALPGAVSAAGSNTPINGSAPFARVYLAIRGCTSCSHCRTSIRQMVRANAQGGEARLSADQVEVRYAKPSPIPLRNVIHSLAENRLHDLSLVDVLFEARGAVATAKNGTATFTLAQTGQVFPVSINPAISRPADGKPVRLTALVEGWRKKGDLALVARSFETLN